MKLPKPGLPRAKYHLNRIETLLEHSHTRQMFEAHQIIVQKLNEMSKKGDSPYYMTRRGLDSYDLVAGPCLRGMGLGDNLVEALSRIAGDRKKLVVQEDGPGEGTALKQLKKQLAGGLLSGGGGITVEAIAVDTNPSEELRKKHREGHIDNLLERRAELYCPDKGVDVIFDMLGPTTYIHPELKYDYLQMRAHTLNPGGVMMVQTTPEPGLNKELEKQGFKVGFYGLVTIIHRPKS